MCSYIMYVQYVNYLLQKCHHNIKYPYFFYYYFFFKFIKSITIQHMNIIKEHQHAKYVFDYYDITSTYINSERM